MKLIPFKEQNNIIAKNQPEYMAMPAYMDDDEEYRTTRVTCCWHLSFKERLKLLWTGYLWQRMLTFRQPIQPQQLTVDKPVMK